MIWVAEFGLSATWLRVKGMLEVWFGWQELYFMYLLSSAIHTDEYLMQAKFFPYKLPSCGTIFTAF